MPPRGRNWRGVCSSPSVPQCSFHARGFRPSLALDPTDKIMVPSVRIWGGARRGLNMAHPTGVERAYAINIRIAIERADYGLTSLGA